MIKSPCIRNCCLDKSDICMGCFRHVDEIIRWQNAPQEEKEKILLRAERRKLRKNS